MVHRSQTWWCVAIDDDQDVGMSNGIMKSRIFGVVERKLVPLSAFHSDVEDVCLSTSVFILALKPFWLFIGHFLLELINIGARSNSFLLKMTWNMNIDHLSTNIDLSFHTNFLFSSPTRAPETWHYRVNILRVSYTSPMLMVLWQFGRWWSMISLRNSWSHVYSCYRDAAVLWSQCCYCLYFSKVVHTTLPSPDCWSCPCVASS